MRNSFCIFFLLWVTLDVFSGEKCLFTIGSDFIVTDTISKNLSDTSRIFNLSDVVVKGSNIITKSDRLILIPTSNMQHLYFEESIHMAILRPFWIFQHLHFLDTYLCMNWNNLGTCYYSLG
jgi:hypothetical protein